MTKTININFNQMFVANLEMLTSQTKSTQNLVKVISFVKF